MCKNLNIHNPTQFARFHQADSNSDFESIGAQKCFTKTLTCPLVFTTLKLKKKTFEDSIIIIWEGLKVKNEDIRKHS